MRGFKFLFRVLKRRFRQILRFQCRDLRFVPGDDLRLFALCRGVYRRAFLAALFLAQELRRELDVGDCVVVREEVELLEHQPEMQPLGAYVRGVFLGGCVAVEERFAVHDDFAAVSGFEKIQTAQKSGLAAAGRTDYGKHLAFLQLEIDAFQHLVTAETFLESVNFEYSHITPYSS